MNILIKKFFSAILPSKRSQQDGPSEVEINSILDSYQKERYEEAESSAILISQQFPNHQFSWKVLGALFVQTGRLSDALVVNKKALVLSPKDSEAHNNLGVILQKIGRLKEAEASYRQAIALKLDYAEAYNNLGNTLQELGVFKEVLESYRKAIALKPDFAEAHYNMGVTLQKIGRLEEAEVSYRLAIALKSDYAEANNNLGNTLQKIGRLEEAIVSYREAIALKLNYAEANNNLGTALQKTGKSKEAEFYYKQAISLKPNYAEAHKHLAFLKKFHKKDEHFIQMKKLYLDKTLTDNHRVHFSFALGKAYEDLDQLAKSFKYYANGNTLRKKLLNYHISQDIELFDQITRTYPSIKKNSLKTFKSTSKPMPIFILGMPRSGTSLVEQIISSHSKVTGAGELPYVARFGDTIARGTSIPSKDFLIKFREKYLEQLYNFSNGNLMVTDKNTQNFLYIGLLSAAFPNIKIIHVERDSAAVCWGNFKQYFSNKSLGFCYQINDIVKYYTLYKNLMKFWEAQCSHLIYNVNYDLLTINQEDETKKIIEYLGLEWEKGCLAPQENIRSVATASSLQVREKVYQGSSQQWKKFKPFLNGALDHLDN